jgi:Universal stress protein family
MTNVLVPTDFTPASLKTVEQAVKYFAEGKVNIILFHAFEIPQFPFEMIRHGYKEPSAELVNEPFRQACKQLKEQCPKEISKIMVRCMNGDTRAVFKNFAEANDVDFIWYPEDYIYTRVHKRSVNPIPLFNKCGVPFLKAASKRKEPVYSNQEFANMELATS